MKRITLYTVLSLSVSACGLSKRPDRAPLGGASESANQNQAGNSNHSDEKKQPVLGDSVANDPLAKDGTNFFPGSETEAPKKRLFRLTQTQYDETIKFLFPNLKIEAISKSLPVDPKQTNYDYADFLLFNAANFSPYTKWVDNIAAAAAANPTAVLDCKVAPPVLPCHSEKAKVFIHRAFRGAEDAAVEAKYLSFFSSELATLDYPQAVARLVSNVLLSPSFAFRAEFSTDGSSKLLPGEQRQNLAYTAADAPVEALIGADVATAEADQFDSLMASPKVKEKLQRFFLDWLEIKKPEEFRIDREKFPEFTDAFITGSLDETKAFLNHYLGQPAPKLSDLIQSRKVFASASVKAAYAADEGKAAGEDHDAKKRMGLFTQPAFIASRSGPIENGIIKRGVFFMRKAMCLETGAVPNGIDTTLYSNTGKTERERVEAKTANAPCSGCHQVINPFGFSFENYDVIGRWRTTEDGEPVDSRITMDFLGEAGTSTESPVEALEFFTKTDRFKQCFVRQVFRFYMGRNENSSDDPTLKAMFTHLKEKDDDLMGLLRTMLTNARFQNRR